MTVSPLTSGPVFYEDHLTNLYYLNELYANVGEKVSRQMGEFFQTEIPITSGIWGGTYLIADKTGKSRRRIWRLYCLVNLPQHSPLDKHENLERLIACYSEEFARAFHPYGLDLKLRMWGGRLPFSNKRKPSITMHMEDTTQQVRWLRAFFTWNQARWEESLIYDLVRIIKEYKEYFDLDRGPVTREAQDLKYILQDIIIMYRTLEFAASEDFREHAEPIIQDLMNHFMAGLHDDDLIRDLYMKVFQNALIYGYEQTLEGPYHRAGLDIRHIEKWPVDKINWVPESLKEKLIPPIKNLFANFKANLENKDSTPTQV